MKPRFEPGNQLVAKTDVEIPGQPALEEGEYVEYEGVDGQTHLVRTTCRETHQIGGPTLGFEVQLELTENELYDLFEVEGEWGDDELPN
jgi:hypothetical protein